MTVRLRPAWVVIGVAVLHVAIWVAALSGDPLLPVGRWVFAQMLSSFALVLASINLVLSTRARPLESAYGGLDKLFAGHRFDGIVVAFVLATHATIVPIGVKLVPGRLLGLLTLAAILVSVVLATAPRAPWRRLLARLRYNQWKDEHRFMGVFVAMGVTHSLLVPTALQVLPVVRLWVYGMATLGVVAYVYRQTAFRAIARRHAYRVTCVENLGDRVLDVGLVCERSPILTRPGQFAFVSFREGPTREQHPFTVSACPSATELRFSIKASGDWTDALQEHLAAGSPARIEGPYGRFEPLAGRPRQLWLAGGIGITPFLATAPVLDAGREVTLVWSVRTAEEAVHLGELRDAEARTQGLRVLLWPTAEKGHVQLASLGLDQPSALEVYVCGPVPMRDAFLGQLEQLGVERGRIHYEEFSLR